MDDGGGPVIGSITLLGAAVGTPVTLSNNNNTGVLGWRWEVIDAPDDSPTLIPLPPPTFASTRVIAPDVKGATVLVRLTTYTDVARTIVDAVDQKAIRVRYELPFDWVIPAAQQSVEADALRGWATDINRVLRDVHEGGGTNFSYKQIDTGQVITIPTNQQMIVSGGLINLGTLINLGELVLI
jgi:cellulase/cellobiase CelA1